MDVETIYQLCCEAIDNLHAGLEVSRVGLLTRVIRKTSYVQILVRLRNKKNKKILLRAQITVRCGSDLQLFRRVASGLHLGIDGF